MKRKCPTGTGSQERDGDGGRFGESYQSREQVNPSEVEGYALRNRKLREQRGLEFRANVSAPQNYLEDLLKHGVLGPTPRFRFGGSRVGHEKLHF